MKWTAEWREPDEHKWWPLYCPDFEHKSQAHDWVSEQPEGGYYRVVPVTIASREVRYNEIVIALKREQEKVSAVAGNVGPLNTIAHKLNKICKDLESLNATWSA